MILPKPTDAIHYAWLCRLLVAICDDRFLASCLRFKGGTCAAMRGFIERFSVDLDFDLLQVDRSPDVQRHLEAIFLKLGLRIDDKSAKVPQYFLKYENSAGLRNTIEIDVTFPPPESNDYEAVRFIEIDRVLYCHTIETMFANKLVSILDRFEKHGSFAGRDIFDVHTFFLKGFSYNRKVIEERTGMMVSEFLVKLKKFIGTKFTQTIIDQDLNSLLASEAFQNVRHVLKREVLMFL